ncbi:MAG: T9SS type A sorting domain-containing protein [Bacteroidetes bacterium]|nr:T9SS type A sorting domain-containing protein [Bacteroidota bacterium]
MKKLILLLFITICASTSKSQSLQNSEWFGTNPPSINLYFLFGQDTLFYATTASGYSPLSLYTSNNGQFAIFDLGTSCSDTGNYTYVIQGTNLIFTPVVDLCAQRRNTLTQYSWVRINTGVSETKIPGNNLLQFVNPAVEGISAFKYNGNNFTAAQIIVCDMYGRKIYSENLSDLNGQINLSDFTRGMYLVSLIEENINYTFKIFR